MKGRHVLGVVGLLAAFALIIVSGLLNYRFGYSLGKTDFDGQIYGAASVAADVMKVAVPFFVAYAWYNKKWSQMIAALIVGAIVIPYSMTSAIGHTSVNRADVSSQRVAATDKYKDARSDIKRLETELSWIPSHRPVVTVQALTEGHKAKRAWETSEACTKPQGEGHRVFCQEHHALAAELGYAMQHAKLSSELKDLKAKSSGAVATAEVLADPQAAMLAKLGAVVFGVMSMDNIQLVMAIFVAVMIEIGSTLGVYIAMSAWRETKLVDVGFPPVATAAVIPDPKPATIMVQEKVEPVVVVQSTPMTSTANDNVTEIRRPVPSRALAEAMKRKAERDAAMRARPGSGEAFFEQELRLANGFSVTQVSMYDAYCAWCSANGYVPKDNAGFAADMSAKGVQTMRLAGRPRYLGVQMKGAMLKAA